MLDITKEIKKILIDEDLTQAQLAEKINTSQGNLANKMKRNNFTTKDLLEISEVLGYELKIEFVKKS
jgi:transcriptional regulator with XRE-family HTH domain